jgi:hypothetical protein
MEDSQDFTLFALEFLLVMDEQTSRFVESCLLIHVLIERWHENIVRCCKVRVQEHIQTY